MPVSTLFLALSLAMTPAGSPSRLDPTDIEALEALLRAMDAEQAEAAPDTGDADAGTAEDTAAEDAAEEEADEEAADEDAGEEGAVGDTAAGGSGAEEDAADGAAEEAQDGATEEGAEEGEETPAARAPEPAPPTRPARPAPRRMGPHVGMQHYAAVRGAPLGAGTELRWQVSISPLGPEGAGPADAETPAGPGAQSRTFIAGAGWAAEKTPQQVWLYDFTARRILTLDRDASTWTNRSLHAAARRNIDIYAALSQGGQAETIAFGPSTSFHRFWLEAAMSVASAPAGLARTSRPAEDAGGTVTTWFSAQDGLPVASAWRGCEGVTLPAAQHRSLVTSFAHRLALHPDILAALREGSEPLCALSFTIISPESPAGRVEHWRLTGTAPVTARSLGFEGAELRPGDSPLIDPEARGAILAALAGERGTPPSPPDFMVEIEALMNEGDHAGAMLTLVQETAHFGLCPAETIGSERLACVGAAALADAGADDADFRAVSEALEAASEGGHRLAIERLQPFLERGGHAGSAARTVVARQLVEWGEAGLAAHEDLDPAGLMAEALAIDPHAVNLYWYLALRYMAAGAPDEAWFFLDTGRALPGREATETLRQARGLERRLEQLAPALYPGSAEP